MAETVPAEQAVEAALIRRCQANEVAAFDAIVSRYQDRIYSFVRRMVRDPGDAEDVAQEVFVKAFQGIRSFDGRASLSTWLFRIASNLCVDYSRKKSRRIDALSMTQQMNEEDHQLDVPDERFDPHQSVIAGEMRTVLAIAVQNLSDKLRSVLLLHDMNNLSYQEIAETLRLPVGTVKSRLFLARGQLQKALRRYLNGDANV